MLNQRYKAWDLIKNKFLWVSCFTFNPNGSIKDIEVLDIVQGKAAPEWRKDAAHLIIVRSTELYDVNGKEIWEGDIVKQDVSTEFGSLITMIGEMVWFDSAFSIRHHSDSPMLFTGKCSKPLIVGNVFMHPSLLPKVSPVDKPAPIL